MAHGATVIGDQWQAQVELCADGVLRKVTRLSVDDGFPCVQAVPGEFDDVPFARSKNVGDAYIGAFIRRQFDVHDSGVLVADRETGTKECFWFLLSEVFQRQA